MHHPRRPSCTTHAVKMHHPRRRIHFSALLTASLMMQRSSTSVARASAGRNLKPIPFRQGAWQAQEARTSPPSDRCCPNRSIAEPLLLCLAIFLQPGVAILSRLKIGYFRPTLCGDFHPAPNSRNTQRFLCDPDPWRVHAKTQRHY